MTNNGRNKVRRQIFLSQKSNHSYHRNLHSHQTPLMLISSAPLQSETGIVIFHSFYSIPYSTFGIFYLFEKRDSDFTINNIF